jgi:hypothetical protein
LLPLREGPTERSIGMIGDGVVVFDCVVHPFNFDPSDALGKAGQMFNQHLYGFHLALTPADEPKLQPEQFLREWSVAEINRMVYEESAPVCWSRCRYRDRPVPRRALALAALCGAAATEPGSDRILGHSQSARGSHGAR